MIMLKPAPRDPLIDYSTRTESGQGKNSEPNIHYGGLGEISSFAIAKEMRTRRAEEVYHGQGRASAVFFGHDS